MNADELMDKAIKEANKSAERIKKKTNSFSEADREKIRKVSELTTGYLEAMITLSWKNEGDESLRSSLASSMQVIEELTEKTLEQIGGVNDYRKTGKEVKKFYGRVNSVLKKVDYPNLSGLIQ